MNAFTRIFCGAIAGLATSAVAAAIILNTPLANLAAEHLGFTQMTLGYYLTCLCLCIALIVVSPAARKQAKLMLLFAIAVIMVVQVGFQSLIESPYSSGEPLDAVKDMLSELLSLTTKSYMYVMPALVTVMYALIAFGAEEARNEAEKSLMPSKD